MKFYLEHILTREITNKRNYLVIIFHTETFPEAILIFIKQKKEKDPFQIIPFILLQHTSYS